MRPNGSNREIELRVAMRVVREARDVSCERDHARQINSASPVVTPIVSASSVRVTDSIDGRYVAKAIRPIFLLLLLLLPLSVNRRNGASHIASMFVSRFRSRMLHFY